MKQFRHLQNNTHDTYLKSLMNNPQVKAKQNDVTFVKI